MVREQVRQLDWLENVSNMTVQGCTDTSPGCGYNDNCEDTDSITRKWSCGREGGAQGKWRKYYGRGAKQLSYNFNYGQFSQVTCTASAHSCLPSHATKMVHLAGDVR